MSWAVTTEWSGYPFTGTTLIEDVGPYIGPWPPAPPIPAALALDPTALCVAYLVSAPNLSDPPNPPPAGGDYHFAGRYGSSPAATQHYWSDSTTTAPPAGAHLFVLTDADPQTVDGADIAPALYCATCTGPTVLDPASGAWSAVQTGVGTSAAVCNPDEYTMQLDKTVIDAGGDLDTVALISGEQPVVASGGDSHVLISFPGTTEAIYASFASKKRSDSVGGNPPLTSWGLTFTTAVLQYRPVLPDPDWRPSPLAGLIEGVDYAAIPGKAQGAADLYVRYPADPWVFTAWRNSSVYRFVGSSATHTGSAAAIPAPAVTFRFAWLPDETLVSTRYFVDGDGTTLATDVCGDVNGTSGPFTVPLSGVPLNFVMIIQPDMAQPLPSESLTMPASFTDPANGYNYETDVQWSTRSSGRATEIVCVADFAHGDWQMWVLSPLSPSLGYWGVAM